MLHNIISVWLAAPREKRAIQSTFIPSYQARSQGGFRAPGASKCRFVPLFHISKFHMQFHLLLFLLFCISMSRLHGWTYKVFKLHKITFLQEMMNDEITSVLFEKGYIAKIQSV